MSEYTATVPLGIHRFEITARVFPHNPQSPYYTPVVTAEQLRDHVVSQIRIIAALMKLNGQTGSASVRDQLHRELDGCSYTVTVIFTSGGEQSVNQANRPATNYVTTRLSNMNTAVSNWLTEQFNIQQAIIAIGQCMILCMIIMTEDIARQCILRMYAPGTLSDSASVSASVPTTRRFFEQWHAHFLLKLVSSFVGTIAEMIKVRDRGDFRLARRHIQERRVRYPRTLQEHNGA